MRARKDLVLLEKSPGFKFLMMNEFKDSMVSIFGDVFLIGFLESRKKDIIEINTIFSITTMGGLKALLITKNTIGFAFS